MPNPLLLILLGWIAVASAMTGLWIYQRRTGDSGIVDVAWAAGVGTLAAIYAMWTPHEVGLRKTFVMFVVLFWASR